MNKNELKWEVWGQFDLKWPQNYELKLGWARAKSSFFFARIAIELLKIVRFQKSWWFWNRKTLLIPRYKAWISKHLDIFIKKNLKRCAIMSSIYCSESCLSSPFLSTKIMEPLIVHLFQRVLICHLIIVYVYCLKWVTRRIGQFSHWWQYLQCFKIIFYYMYS